MTEAEIEQQKVMVAARARLAFFVSLVGNPAWQEVQALADEEYERAVKLLGKREATPEKRAEAVELFHFVDKLRKFAGEAMRDCRDTLGIPVSAE